MKRQAIPVLVPDGVSGSSALRRLDLRDKGQYDEAWIQTLVHEHPNLLPIWELEPGLRGAQPVCRELGLPSGGYLDNLLVSPEGDLVLVECKLWRNPEAQRKVVAQIIDYAKELEHMSYQKFEAAVQKARGEPDVRLHELVGTELDEQDFTDSVTRNLRRGRALLLIVGDGVTESAEQLTEYLQQHAGIHFTLALVQLAIYSVPGVGRLVVPSIPVRTTNIVRGIVTVIDGKPKILPPKPDEVSTNLTEENFFERIDQSCGAGVSAALLDLVESGSSIGLSYEVKKTLIIRLNLVDDYVNILVISQKGFADTSYVWWQKDGTSREILARFLEDVASVVGGVVRVTEKSSHVRLPDRPLSVTDILKHREEWLEAVERFKHAIEADRAAGV